MARKRKFIAKNVRKRKLYFSLLWVCVLMIGLGYANLVSNLSINGSLGIDRYDHTLYGVLRKAAKRGTYARKYTGEHQDSMAGDGDQDIYYWYADSNANATAILDKNNVIFAGHCWQMIRTTDTGGVKMIYNGKVEDNKCLNTRGTHVGYNTVTSQNLASNYYYGTSYEYDSTNNIFSLSGTLFQDTWNGTNSETFIGKYTCLSTVSTDTCATLYLVESYSSATSAFLIPLNSDSSYSSFGNIEYSKKSSSFSRIGYMYNNEYSYHSIQRQYDTTAASSFTINTSSYYSDTIDYNETNPNNYTLTNPIRISTLSDYSSLVGKYLINRSSTLYYTVAYYVVAVNGNTVYCRQLLAGDLSTSLTIGDSYTKSGNTYTLTGNVTNVDYIDWYGGSDYPNYLGKYACVGNHTSCTTIRVFINVSRTSYYYWDSTTEYSYSENISYDGTNYTLTGDIKTFFDFYSSTNLSYLPTHHYTCLGNGNSCTAAYYIINTGGYVTYVPLSGAQDINAVVEDALHASNVNQKNSTLKLGIDAWYAKYLIDYDTYIEDTIFCNNRTVKSLGSLKYNGGAIDSEMIFEESSVTSDLSCDRVTDQFSVSNPSAQLTYKVAIMSSPEMKLLNHDSLRGKTYWLFSPTDSARMAYVNASGAIKVLTYNSHVGVRPAISLKSGMEYISGDGSMANPYQLDAEPIGPESFATDSWSVIAQAARTGNTSVYNVGDSRIVNLKGGGNIRVRIANKSTPSECYNSGFSQTSCGLVLWFDIFGGHRMNPYDQYSNSPGNGSIGGWPASELRTYLNSTADPDSIFNRLPDDLQSVIIDTTVVSGNESSSGQNYVSTDKLFLLSFHEVWETNYPDDTAYSNSRQLDIFRDNPTSAFSLMGFAGDTNQWWLRTPAGDITFYSVFFNTGNQIVNSNSSRAEAVAPAFKVG